MKALLMRFIPDVINPLDGLWGRLRHGRMHRFSWRGVTGAHVERILRRYGIPCYGRWVAPDDDERACLVPYVQAKWAEDLLCRAGVPLTCRLLDPKHDGLAGKGKMPAVWKNKDGREVGVRHPSIVARIAKLMGV
jgi:hypothetical protein